MYGISKRLDDEHEVHWGLDGGKIAISLM